jgi:co-chaperonin GroES (HSP10)
MQHLQALSTRLIIQKMNLATTTDSGIILQNPQELHPRALITNVGPKVNVSVKVGDQCMVDWSRTGKMNHNDHEYYLIDQRDIIAVFSE